MHSEESVFAQSVNSHDLVKIVLWIGLFLHYLCMKVCNMWQNFLRVDIREMCKPMETDRVYYVFNHLKVKYVYAKN